jgi:hypothetical protein
MHVHVLKYERITGVKVTVHQVFIYFHIFLTFVNKKLSTEFTESWTVNVATCAHEKTHLRSYIWDTKKTRTVQPCGNQTGRTKEKEKTREKKRKKNQRGWTDCRHATWVGTVGCAPGTRAWVQVGLLLSALCTKQRSHIIYICIYMYTFFIKFEG